MSAKGQTELGREGVPLGVQLADDAGQRLVDLVTVVVVGKGVDDVDIGHGVVLHRVQHAAARISSGFESGGTALEAALE